jgi:hypothetical protein
LNVVSIRETPGRYFEWETRPSSFCWVADTLKLVVEGVAIGTGEEGSVTAERFHAPVVAHGGSRLGGFRTGVFSGLLECNFSDTV